MNREILFRGKRIDNGEWLISKSIDQWDDGRVFLFDEDEGNCIEVIPETVGQFTGLLDKNGKRIFEGDIVKYKRGDIAKVVFDDGAFYGVDKHFISDNIHVKELIEVIGNVHDNPELLEGKK